MEIGSGARVRTFRGRRYFYFWHHERAAGRSVRREDSVGRVDSERAGQELLRRMAAYHRRAEEEFARRRRTLERLVPAAMHTSTWRYIGGKRRGRGAAYSTSRKASAAWTWTRSAEAVR